MKPMHSAYLKAALAGHFVTSSGKFVYHIIYSCIRDVNLQTNASYSVNQANHQAQQDPLYAVIDDQDSAHYTEPPRGTHLPYYQEIQTDGMEAATAFKIPARALVSAHQQPGGVVGDIAPIYC